MIEFKNRQSTNPNRRRLAIISQTPEEIIADIERADIVIGDGEGTPITAETFNNLQTELQDKITEYKNGKACSFTSSSWQGSAAPYNIFISVATHTLGATVNVDYFNNGSDEFEWSKDELGNVTIYSNVKVAMTVKLK